MSYVTIPSYEGSQPFIYVYYAEDDTRLALPVLARLYNEGLRMWSWNGCAAPTDIRASQRISSCAALLIFLSDNLSRDIDREYFEAMEALRCNKVKYFIRLSDVELPFDWGKSDTNIVIDYVRSNEAAFWLSIYDSDILERCRGSWPSQPVKAGLSAFDAIDSSELSDEYSSILKIIGDSPALDRSGVPINAEDIALFAGAGDNSGEPYAEKNDASQPAMHIDDLNSKSIRDLFGMLDEISVSTRQRAEELQQSAEKRRLEQQKAAMSAASLPFQHDVVRTAHSDEPPVPALSFTLSAQAIEEAAAEMFGANIISESYSVEIYEEEQAELSKETDEIIIIDPSETSDASTPELSETAFEEFIDDLTGTHIRTVTEEDSINSENTVSDEPQKADDNAFIPLFTQAKTVDIKEEKTLPPPASGSLTGFTLPDDNYITTVHLVHEDEPSPPQSAAERAAAAEQSRKQFESALENAAYKVTGRIIARHSKGIHSVGLKVKKPESTVKRAPKIVKVKAESSARNIPKKEALPTPPPSRVQRRKNRHRKGAAAEKEAMPTVEENRRISVVPDPVRVVPSAEKAPAAVPSEPVVPPVSPNPTRPSEEAVVSQSADTASSAQKNVRKKRHPHNSSGLMGVLRQLRSQQSTQPETEPSEPTAEETEQD